MASKSVNTLTKQVNFENIYILIMATRLTGDTGANRA